MIPDQIVAIVPAFNRADSVAATVAALLELDDVSGVVVVDDGSSDDTAARAAESGARVVVLEQNQGKAAAVRAGWITTDAPILLLVDSDTGATAAEAVALIPPVVGGHLDMSIAVLPSAGGRGGFGLVKNFAANVLKQGTGADFAAPLSGQRCLRSEVMSALGPVDRFGLEVALTLDAATAGFRVGEVEAGFDHHHTGRTLAGFRHRFRQGRDLYRAGSSRIGHRAMLRALTTSLRAR
ncbi:MAG: glycosyltransferase [Actinomycetia bacterium]|nr:glycosyltransferase [Actinomycetes bacterium]MCP4962962.1 glycosyltransferase [Actinomycetes bacterium]